MLPFNSKAFLVIENDKNFCAIWPLRPYSHHAEEK